MRIVGIGASAGGLAALEEFFSHTPADTGMAFIVVQHLDPKQKALLPELLQRSTRMQVFEAQQDDCVQPDTVYVIPSNTELRYENGRLLLERPRDPTGLRLPINVLFSSLASACTEHAIAVVLSGMGSDGTLGMQAVRATGGLTAVQDPETAQFEAMPRSAIAAGCDDIVAPPGELPQRILSYTRYTSVRVEGEAAATSLQPIESIVAILQKTTRHDFSLYKSSTLHRRIERRMAIHGIGDFNTYALYLEANSQEVRLLFNELLIGVTQFFRDPQVWEYLVEDALPALLAREKPESGWRAWVIGCSTGEEAYTLAMLFTEAIELSQVDVDTTIDVNFKIFASDLSLDAVTTARAGRYPRSIEEHVSEQRLARFFTLKDDYYQINQNIRDKVLFAQHDVILDPPFTSLDIIACRNLLIYFDPMLQRRLLPLFHYSLRANGLLLLGNSETVGRLNYLFEHVKTKMRVYRRLNHDSISGSSFLLKSFPPLSSLSKEHPMSAATVPPAITDTLQAAADQLLLQVYSPAAVVLNGEADIVYISGRTGKYLEPAAGKANWNIHAMAREGLRIPLYTALQQAALQSEQVEINNLVVRTGSGEQHVDVAVQTLQEPGVMNGMTMVVFRDVANRHRPRRSRKTSGDASDNSGEIERYQHAIEKLSEEARLSREELQTSNEELQSTNEELQSANEELTSSKEEMQSMNEELQTINAELQTKLDDLALAQSDMQNVLNSIEIAILFMDQKLNVRRYTSRASAIISLRESDVGRPLSELTTILEYPELEEDAKKTLDTLVVSEKQITTREGRWFSIRIMPYRRLDNLIDGVVMTMVDITDTKELESSLRLNSSGETDQSG
jgi:two-component system CheB/CheR fusion protein